MWTVLFPPTPSVSTCYRKTAPDLWQGYTPSCNQALFCTLPDLGERRCCGLHAVDRKVTFGLFSWNCGKVIWILILLNNWSGHSQNALARIRPCCQKDIPFLWPSFKTFYSFLFWLNTRKGNRTWRMVMVWLKWWCSIVDVLYTAARGVCSFFIHELVRPRWSKSWHNDAKNMARACRQSNNRVRINWVHILHFPLTNKLRDCSK